MTLNVLLLAVASRGALGYDSIPYRLSGRNEQPEVHANISGIEQPVVMKVWYGSPYHEYLRWAPPHDSSIISLGEYEFVDSHVDASLLRPGVSLDLEVGPGSPFLSSTGSISLLKHTSMLVWGATEDQFLAVACQPNSSVSVPFFAMPAISLGWISSSVSGDFVIHSGLRSVSFSGIDGSAMFLLPAELAEEVYLSMTSIGAELAIPLSNELRFSRCTRERASEVLPVYNLVLTDSNSVILSHISLSGEDYMWFDSATSTCRSKFHVWNPSNNRDSFVIDPFQLPGINVRSTAHSITLCDSP